VQCAGESQMNPKIINIGEKRKQTVIYQTKLKTPFGGVFVYVLGVSLKLQGFQYDVNGCLYNEKTISLWILICSMREFPLKCMYFNRNASWFTGL